MFSLKDITNFSNTQDYLPIFNAALITDLTVILMTISGYIKSKTLKEWYHKYEISAVIADVLSIFIGVIAARFIYSTFFTNTSGIFIFIVIAVMFQVCHDLLFANLFNSIPRGKSGILDTFKDYAKEMGFNILLADASMIISTIVLGSILANLDTNSNIIISVVLVYLTPYLLYSV
jgi:hypothetical protein